jgi:hypothetical protein
VSGPGPKSKPCSVAIDRLAYRVLCLGAKTPTTLAQTLRLRTHSPIILRSQIYNSRLRDRAHGTVTTHAHNMVIDQTEDLVAPMDAGPANKVWFVDVVTRYGQGNEHSVPVHVALEQCTEVLNAKYIAVVDQNCPCFTGTKKWLRVIHNSRNATIHDLAHLVKQKHYNLAVDELKTKLSTLFELWSRTRSLLKEITKNASYVIIYLDHATQAQILAVLLSVASLAATRNKTIVWFHFHRHDRLATAARFARSLLNIFPAKVLGTAYTSEIAAENRKYGTRVDILPHPLNPALNALACNPKSTNNKNKINVHRPQHNKLVCWLFLTRPEQGLELLPSIISHTSAKAFQHKFIKCFVRELAVANIKDTVELELVRLPYLSEEEYQLYFNQCEVILLPYSAHLFGGMMSGAFTEAVAKSKIPIVSDGTVMAAQLRRFQLGDLVMDFTNGFSWTLINEIRKDNSIRARLNSMAESYIREHDAFGCAQSLYTSLKKIDPTMPLSEPKRVSEPRARW